jgi:hypothetical protein
VGRRFSSEARGRVVVACSRLLHTHTVVEPSGSSPQASLMKCSRHDSRPSSATRTCPLHVQHLTRTQRKVVGEEPARLRSDFNLSVTRASLPVCPRTAHVSNLTRAAKEGSWEPPPHKNVGRTYGPSLAGLRVRRSRRSGIYAELTQVPRLRVSTKQSDSGRKHHLRQTV